MLVAPRRHHHRMPAQRAACRARHSRARL